MRVLLVSSAPLRSGASASFGKIEAGLVARGHSVVRLAPGPRPPGAVRIRRACRTQGTEVILADQPRDVGAATAATRGVPVALVYRYNRSRDSGPAGALEHAAMSRLSGCIFQGWSIRAQALEEEPRLVSVPGAIVPNGFDTEWFAPGPEAGRRFRARHRITPGARVVLSVGALTGGKGHAVGIAAAGLLRDTVGDLVYLLAGDGPAAAELKTLAEGVSLPLVQLGWLDAGDLRDAYRAADIVLHPSDHEIFPNVVGEAMACGCAVVATDSGGTCELVGAGGRAGLLVPPRDAGALARAAAVLLADAGRRTATGRAARARVRAEFPLSRMIQGTECALEAAIARFDPCAPSSS